MGKILVTPPGAEVIATGSDRSIAYPPLEKFVLVDSKLARAKGKDRIAAPDFEDRLKAYANGETVDLAGGGQLRLGVSFGLIINGEPRFGKFSATHPTRANMLTPAAGIYGDESFPETPLEAAYRELCEEFIPHDNTVVGCWQLHGQDILQARSISYAAKTGLVYDPTCFSLTLLTSPLHGRVSFGSKRYQVLSEFEEDTSAHEIQFTGSVLLPDGWTVSDGEQFPDGTWRDEPIIPGRDAQNYPMTTKARVLLAAYAASLTPL